MIKFVLKNSRKPVGCWLDYYFQNGILQVGMDIAKAKKVQLKDFVISYHLYANSKTSAMISRKILNSWLYYNIDKETGLLKEGASPRKNKEKVNLTELDYQALRYDEIQYGVTIDDKVPDNEIQFRMNKNDTHEDIIVLNKEDAAALCEALKNESTPNDNLKKLFKD